MTKAPVHGPPKFTTSTENVPVALASPDSLSSSLPPILDNTFDVYTETAIDEERHIIVGSCFNMDLGFMRGTGFHSKADDGCSITSIDGKNSFLLCIDRKSHRIWIFTLSTKQPPLDISMKFLKTHGSKTNSHRTIHTDQGGQLARSQQFRDVISDAGFLLETTGTDAPNQNGLAERPNRTLAIMVWCMLHAAGLSPLYWTYALMHAIYVYNRRQHFAIAKTPYEAYCGQMPDLSALRIFGCRIFAKFPGEQPAKLDTHTSQGIFSWLHCHG
jgi:transposase InsO family protein